MTSKKSLGMSSTDVLFLQVFINEQLVESLDAEAMGMDR
jgi:hypothetical protein